MNMRKITFAAALLAGALSTGAAQARGAVDVQWQVTIGSPQVHLPGGAVVLLPPLPLPRAVVAPRRDISYPAPQRRDADRDGIPNRYDPVYNPRWDVDGDGIPNRYDRYPRGGHPGYGQRDWRDDRRDDRREWRDDRRDDRKDWRDDRRGHGGRHD
jgi:hypothetical protein